MSDESAEAIVEVFKMPRCKMISATLMAPLVGEKMDQAKANEKMESIRPLLGKFSTELLPPLNHMFSVNLVVWAMPDKIRSGFFIGDDLSLNGLVKIITDGANEWHRTCRENNLDGKSIRPLFAALKEIIEELFDHDIKKKSWPAQFMKLQDDFLESFDY